MPETIQEPKKGESILGWCKRVAREVIRLAKLLDVNPSTGLEIVGGTLRATKGSEDKEWVLYPATGVPAKSGNIPGTATITHYRWDGTNLTLDTTRTETIRNPYKTAVAAVTGGKDGWAVRRWGVLWVATEACT